jgi:hypothetical protein
MIRPTLPLNVSILSYSEKKYRFGQLISPVPRVNESEHTYGADLTQRAISVRHNSGHSAC